MEGNHDIILISEERNKFLSKVKDNKTLGLDGVENKDIFLFAVALGLHDPKNVEGPKFTYVRRSYIKTEEKSLLAALLLGTIKEGNSIDDYADLKKCILLSEKCAERGFEELENIINDSEGDDERLTRRLMKQLDLWYNQNVGSDF